MSNPYKRRRSSLLRNFWIYRKLVALAMVLGLMLWFIWANNAPVTVAFPFRLGSLSSSLGLVILMSALVGAVVSALALTVFFSLRRRHAHAARSGDDATSALPDDRPPSDYASKTTEGFSESHWS